MSQGDQRADLARAIISGGGDILHMHKKQHSLEEMFLNVTSKND